MEFLLYNIGLAEKCLAKEIWSEEHLKAFLKKSPMPYYAQLKYDECWQMPGFSALLVQRQEERAAGEEEAKSSRETSMPTSFVFPTIQFTRVHLHLCYFHSNSGGAIRSIFDIGTWLWRRSCDFCLNGVHDKKGLADSSFPLLGCYTGFLYRRLPPF